MDKVTFFDVDECGHAFVERVFYFPPGVLPGCKSNQTTGVKQDEQEKASNT